MRNGYTVKILNKTQDTRAFRLSHESDTELAMKVVGTDAQLQNFIVDVESDNLRAIRVFLTKSGTTAPVDNIPVTFRVTDIDLGTEATYDATFVGGGQ